MANCIRIEEAMEPVMDSEGQARIYDGRLLRLIDGATGLEVRKATTSAMYELPGMLSTATQVATHCALGPLR